jgi:hypothetical protein
MGKLADTLAGLWPLQRVQEGFLEAERHADWRLRGLRMVRRDDRPRAEPVPAFALCRADHWSYADWSLEDIEKCGGPFRHEDHMIRVLDDLTAKLHAQQEAEIEMFLTSGAMVRDISLEVGPVVLRTEDGPRYFSRTYHLGQHWRIK